MSTTGKTTKVSQSAKKPVNVKQEVKKVTKKSEKEIENEESENEESENEESDEEESDEEESDEDKSDNEQEQNDETEDDKEPDKKKEKPKKLSHKELTSILISNEERITEINNSRNALELQLKTLDREEIVLRKTNLKYIKLLDKAHDEDIAKTRKEKKKRKVTENSGILKNKPIPPILIKFLELEAGTELPRTKIMSLLSNKFNSLGLRKGQDIILDKTTAKFFGKEDKYVIEFKYFQRFLKEVYGQLDSSHEITL